MSSLARWSPFGDLFAMPRDIERVFDWTIPRTRLEANEQLLMPTMDVLHRGDDMVVRIELPGMTESDVEIGVTDGVLTVSGEHKEEKETKREDYVLKESSYGQFERRVALPAGVDPETIHADFTHGMLEVTIPGAKALESPKTHHVAIGTGTKH